ncbi:MAG: MBL fold metallo-hydrolase [Ignavibacteriales bacterium]|nr:MBL fold metallo-hydrolase [Ignavibacteriales bacterium]
MKRRNFVKHISLAFAGTFLAPLFIKSDSIAEPRVKLNYKPEPHLWNNDSLTLAWIGHSTVLINFFGKWIVTDPVLFDNIGLYFLGNTIGPQRVTPPALSVDEFPKPDIILLSHAHMDHMDYQTLKHFAEKYPGEIEVITAYLTKDVIVDLPWKSISILDWNDERTQQNISFRALEVKHFGWRFPWERDRSRGYFKDGRSYNAYIIEYNGKKILFGGDTAMTDKLQIAKNVNVDIALMPIGAYNPWKRNHCNPEEALQMAAEINARYFIPIHTKTFRQGVEPFNEPVDWLKKSAVNYPVELGLDEIGQTFVLR